MRDARLAIGDWRLAMRRSGLAAQALSAAAKPPAAR
jgi:hypothetical protein